MAPFLGDLSHGPFTVSQARHAGLRWENLQSRSWRRLSRGQYAWTGLRHDVELKLRAVAQRLPSEYAFSGPTAGWILGLDIQPCDSVEATVPRELPVRARAGVTLRRASLPRLDVTTHRGFRVTTPLRTVRDLGSRVDIVESVVAVDMALHAGMIDLTELSSWVESSSGAKGIKRLRRALSLADSRAESPMETRLRLELVTAGLPSPCVQAELRDNNGQFLARVDLYYPDVGLVIEFDGQNHKERLVDDSRRQNSLINAGTTYCGSRHPTFEPAAWPQHRCDRHANC